MEAARIVALSRLYDPSKPFNAQIRELIRSTHPQSGPIRISPSGKRFDVSIDPVFMGEGRFLPVTDGIGTKGSLYWSDACVSNASQDAFAMVANDLAESGSLPIILQDHIMVQGENHQSIFMLVQRLVSLCQENQWEFSGEKYPAIITGGETAIINTLNGMELGITAIGYVKKGSEIGKSVQDRDVLIGIASNGIHSNGISFVMDGLLRKGADLDSTLPYFEARVPRLTFRWELTKPANVYLEVVSSMIQKVLQAGASSPAEAIHGMVHITGGGLSKLKELSNPNVDILVNREHTLNPQSIFKYIHSDMNFSSKGMYSTFNNGIGYVVAVAPAYTQSLLEAARNLFNADIIGSVVSGNGKVIIESKYEPLSIEY